MRVRPGLAKGLSKGRSGFGEYLVKALDKGSGKSLAMDWAKVGQGLGKGFDRV